MRNASLCVVTAALVVMSGCSSISGTWTADKSGDSTSPIAKVSFCDDGTFTASADYGGGKTHVMSGHYTTTRGGELELDADGSQRTYSYTVDNDTLTIGKAEKSAKMNRLKPKSKW